MVEHIKEALQQRRLRQPPRGEIDMFPPGGVTFFQSKIFSNKLLDVLSKGEEIIFL